MKMMIVAIACLFSANAFALSANDSWSAIRSSRVAIDQPQFARAFGDQGLFNACVEGDLFKSVTPVTVCTEWKAVKKGSPGEEGEWTEYTCVSSKEEDVVLSRNATETVCLEYVNNEAFSGCVKHGTVNVVYPTSYKFNVINAEGGEAYQALLF